MNNSFLQEVKDMFGLYIRIKDIKPSYKLFFNLKTKNYEVHDMSNKHNSLCLTIPKCELNACIIRKLHKTKRENMKSLFIEIESCNDKLEKQKISHEMEKAGDAMREIINFASHTSKDVSIHDMKNIIQKLGD